MSSALEVHLNKGVTEVVLEVCYSYVEFLHNFLKTL